MFRLKIVFKARYLNISSMFLVYEELQRFQTVQMRLRYKFLFNFIYSLKMDSALRRIIAIFFVLQLAKGLSQIAQKHLLKIIF